MPICFFFELKVIVFFFWILVKLVGRFRISPRDGLCSILILAIMKTFCTILGSSIYLLSYRTFNSFQHNYYMGSWRGGHLVSPIFTMYKQVLEKLSKCIKIFGQLVLTVPVPFVLVEALNLFSWTVVYVHRYIHIFSA